MLLATDLQAWVKRDLANLQQERSALLAVQDSVAARRRAAFRLLLVQQLSTAMETNNVALMMQCAAMIDVRSHADVWIETGNDASRAWLDDTNMLAKHPEESLDRIAREAFGARRLTPSQIGGIGVFRRAVDRMEAFELPYQTKRAFRSGVEQLAGEPAASEAVLEALAGAIDELSDSLDAGTPHGPRPLVLALREVDRRVYGRLSLLETQARWLFACEDPWTRPEALQLLRTMHQLATLRTALAAVTDRHRFAGMSQSSQDEALAIAELIAAGGVSKSHAKRLEALIVERGQSGDVAAAIQSINWPERDQIARLTWRPGEMAGESAWHLVERMRESQAVTSPARMEAASASVQRAAAEVLRVVGR
jgi:hypothetical protein